MKFENYGGGGWEKGEKEKEEGVSEGRVGRTMGDM